MFKNNVYQEHISDIGLVTFYKKRRTRNVRLRIKSPQDISVSVPWYCPLSMAKYFVKQRQDWIRRSIKKFDQKKILKKPLSKDGVEKLREKSRKIINPKVAQVAARNGFHYGDIRIKDMTGRWGSCSGKKNLNFSMYLALLPEKYLDYVVAHELCHTVQMNHSKAFWDLLESVYPGAKKIDREMRQFQVV